MLTPRIMKLHRYIDHDWQMTPIDFQVTRTKVKVTVTGFPANLEIGENLEKDSLREKSGNLGENPEIREKSGNFVWPDNNDNFHPIAELHIANSADQMRCRKFLTCN
ncbi:hypothetical protein DPMN_187218 [Dreissena polymorpha]|uniref:Uncharacterized protein n=1 Tax=Dreissena polymorpha TaxID=45954 RepID=A0A9D4DMX5_DREPO|nr:hypothetical protein DPMN_187218 [Dreissena polymorpha]